MLILASVHWRKINGINFSHYKTFTNILNIWLWTISNKLWSMVNTIVDLHSIILMQLLIISSLKSVSRYVSYREASIAIRIVSWGECIVAALINYLFQVLTTKVFEPQHVKTNKMICTPSEDSSACTLAQSWCAVWPESSQSVEWVAKDPRFLHADSEDCDQTGHGCPGWSESLLGVLVILLVLSCCGSFVLC